MEPTHETLIMAVQAQEHCPDATIEVVGGWIWASFPSKPDDTIRQWLRDNRFHWNHRRMVWQWAGCKSRPSEDSDATIKAKYQTVGLQ